MRKSLLSLRARRLIGGVLLVLPALLLIVSGVAFPLVTVFTNAVVNTTAADALPATAQEIRSWPIDSPPSEALAQTLVRELRAAIENRSIPRLGSALEAEYPGFRNLLTRTSRQFRDDAPDGGSALAMLVEADERWATPYPWVALQRATSLWTPSYLLKAVDMTYGSEGRVERIEANQAIFVAAIWRTLWISALVTAVCAVLAYPAAYLLASTSGAAHVAAVTCVLLPFWTSLLVRTSAWIVLLQRQGLANDLLLSLGVTSERVQLIYNLFGVIIAMVHVLLPFMVLPIFASMRSIPVEHVRAGLSLGARPATVLARVYLPQTLPGLRTGVLLVFVIALGFYITPALVGGPSEQMLSGFIASYLNERLDWSMASALAVVLITIIAVSYALLAAATRPRY